MNATVSLGIWTRLGDFFFRISHYDTIESTPLFIQDKINLIFTRMLGKSSKDKIEKG